MLGNVLFTCKATCRADLVPSALSSLRFFNEQQKKNINTRFHLSMQVYSNLLLKPSLHFHMLVVFILVLI